jgi:hypothetical protein
VGPNDPHSAEKALFVTESFDRTDVPASDLFSTYNRQPQLYHKHLMPALSQDHYPLFNFPP